MRYKRAIYAHWGYTEALFSEREDGETVLYFCKELAVRREQQMVRFLLACCDGSICTYWYYPEGREEYGIILLDIVTGEGQISQLAPSDAFRRYAFHALHRIEDEVAKGVLPEKGTVAWY